MSDAAHEHEYVLGTDEEELSRLGFQHQLWSEAAHGVWERAGVQPGSTVLDVGCGPGYASLDLASLVGPVGEVVGIDVSARFIAAFEARARALGIRNARAVVGDLGDLQEATGLRAGSVDVVYARWVFCFLPNVREVLRSLVTLLRPGGTLIVQDYFNYEAMTIAPRSDVFSKVVAATARSWRDRGGDPDVMGCLPRWAAEEGFTIEHQGVHQRLALSGSMMWHWPKTFWTSFNPSLVELGLIDQADADAFQVDLDRVPREPGSFVLLPPVFDLIATKAR